MILIINIAHRFRRLCSRRIYKRAIQPLFFLLWNGNFPFHKRQTMLKLNFRQANPSNYFVFRMNFVPPFNWWKNRLRNRIGLLTGNLQSAPKCICWIFKSSFASIWHNTHTHTYSAASSFATWYTYFDDCGRVIVEITFSNGSQMIGRNGCIMHDDTASIILSTISAKIKYFNWL